MDRFAKWVAWSKAEPRKLSQDALAARLGVHQTYVSKMCSGRRTADLKTALAIERETADWPDGPILVSEWGDAGEPAAEAS